MRKQQRIMLCPARLIRHILAALHMWLLDAPAPRDGRSDGEVLSEAEAPPLAFDDLRVTVQFDAAWDERLHQQIVDDERDFGIACGDIFILARIFQPRATDVEACTIEFIAHGVHIGLSGGRDCAQPRQGMGLEIFQFFLRKHAVSPLMNLLRRFLHQRRHMLLAVAEDAAGAPDLDVSSWLAAWLPLVRDHTTTYARYLGFHGMCLLY